LQRFDFLKLLIQRDKKRRNMNSKVWIRKALSTCLAVAILATYSMVALAGERVTGELLVSGKNINGESSFVQVNGEAAQSGRSIFSSSTIATPQNASAIINLGKAGKIEIAPNTTFVLSFDNNSISGDLLSGRVTVLNASETVNVKTSGGKVLNLKAGESAASQQDDDDSSSSGSSAWWAFAVIFGGALVGAVWVATSDSNSTALGGSTTVVSPNR
jgi:hypothetical protein